MAASRFAFSDFQHPAVGVWEWALGEIGRRPPRLPPQLLSLEGEVIVTTPLLASNKLMNTYTASVKHIALQRALYIALHSLLKDPTPMNG